MAKGFAPPKRFRAKGDLRKTLEINFRYLGNWLNDTFGQPAFTPPFVPYAPRMWRGQGDLLPILNRNWRYTITYINTFVSSEPTLAGVPGFASWPPFKGAAEDDKKEAEEAIREFQADGMEEVLIPNLDEGALSVMVAKNWSKLVTYLNGEVAPLL